jgi:DNA-binding SARP family transcriptional activator/pimeloyl-ACP methyl ester carboxylesterase
MARPSSTSRRFSATATMHRSGSGGLPSAWMLFRVFGPPAVLRENGELMPPKGRNQRVLLAALICNAPRVVSVDRLVEAIWGARPPADPHAALHTQVSRLRALLRSAGRNPEGIAREPHGYRLAALGDEIDAARFGALIAAARASPTPEEALTLIDEALALWRGEPYEEFSGDSMFLGEISRLGELRTTALERRAELLLALGRTDDALVALEPLVQEAPLRERPVALHMEALYRAGRQGEALDAFQRFRRRLSEELGLDPSPSLRQLETEILQHERSLGAASAQAPTPRPADGSRAPFLHVSFRLRGTGGRLAYAEAGQGAPLLSLPAWISNLAAIGAGSDPRSPFMAALSARCRLVLYDRMGMGLSTGSAPDASIEAGVDEALGVLDATGIAKGAALAVSQAGPIALTLAARYPARITRLVLVGTYASGPRTFPRADVRAPVLALIRAHWGLGSKVLADMIMPGASAEDVETFARVQRESATPAAAAAALEQLYETDVSDILSQIVQPALVVHYDRDTAIPYRASQELAAGLPNATLVTLSGRAHLPSGMDADRVAELVSEFVEQP